MKNLNLHFCVKLLFYIFKKKQIITYTYLLLFITGSGIKLTEEEVDAFLNVEFNGYKNKEISFDDFIYK